MEGVPNNNAMYCKGMKDVVFIGGFENTGTRLVVQFLLKTGYASIRRNGETQHNKMFDYQAKDGVFLRLFDQYWNRDEASPLLSVIKEDIDSQDGGSIVIKHGHLCFLTEELKANFKNCKNILCIRDPLDMLLKNGHNYHRYGKLSKNPEPSLKDKFHHLKQWYSDDIVEKSDVVLRLEDMVFDTRNTFRRLATALNIPCTDEILDDFCGMIVPSKSIGKGRAILSKNGDSELLREIETFASKFKY